MTVERGEWDDRRLEAAFAARAGAASAAGHDLAQIVLARIERERQPADRIRWLAPAAAAAVLLVVVGVVGLGSLRTPPTSATPGPTGPPGGAIPSAAAQPDPMALIGPPVSVSQALAIRAAGVDDREIAVSGFLSEAPVLPCPFVPADPNPTAIYCPQSFQWLMEQPEVLWVTSGDTTSGGPPKGPALHPSLALVVPPVFPGGGATLPPPIPVVLVGHFDDRRAALCPVDHAPGTPCADTFLVDRVAEIAGQAQGITTLLVNERWDDATQTNVVEQPTTTVEEIDGLVAAAAPGSTVLSRQLRTGKELGTAEPLLARDALYVSQRLVWLVTVGDVRNGVAVARTLLVVDGSKEVVEITPSGVVKLTPMLPSTPTPTPSQLPSGGPARPAIDCGDLAANDCVPAADAVAVTLADQPGHASRIVLQRGVFCPTPGLLSARTTCPAGSISPIPNGTVVGSAIATFDGETDDAYLNLWRADGVIRAFLIARATPPAPPSPSDVASVLFVPVGSGATADTAEIRDRDRVLFGARAATATDVAQLAWIRKVDPAGDTTVEVADVPGRAGHVAVRWLDPTCRPTLDVYGIGNNPGTVGVLPPEMKPACSQPPVERTVILEFRAPVRAADVDVLSLSGG